MGKFYLAEEQREQKFVTQLCWVGKIVVYIFIYNSKSKPVCIYIKVWIHGNWRGAKRKEKWGSGCTADILASYT